MCNKGRVVSVPTPDWLWDSRANPEHGVFVDECIAVFLLHAWEKGLRTLGSCCGHFEEKPSVVLTADKEMVELGRQLLPGWDLFQWQLVDVTKEV